VRCFPLEDLQRDSPSQQEQEGDAEKGSVPKGVIVFFDVGYNHAMPQIEERLLGMLGYSPDRVIVTQLRSFQEAYRKDNNHNTVNSKTTSGGECLRVRVGFILTLSICRLWVM